MKNQQYQDDYFETSVDIFTLADDVRYGYKVFRELILQHKKLIVPLHEVHEEEMENKENCDDFSITFKTINNHFNASNYESITQVAADIRNLVEQFYRLLGKDHYLLKNAQTLERIFEQKIALLPRLLRDQCSIEATNVQCNKAYLNQELYGNRRRGGKSSDGGETPIMFQMRHEMEIIERRKRQQREEERRLKHEQLKKQLIIFEQEVLTGKMKKKLRTCWEIPCVGIFVYMLQDYLDIQHFNYTEFELGALFMERSNLFAKIFTALMYSPHQRKRIKDKQLNLKFVPSFPEIVKDLNKKISKWYSTADYQGVEAALEKFGFCQTFFNSLGEDNPLTDDIESFIQLTLQQKMTILKTLCEVSLNGDESMCQTLSSVPVLQRQDLYLGQDNEKHTYYFFPQFNTTDIRLFKKFKTKKSNNINDEYELIAWDVESLEQFMNSMKKIRKSKNSNFYDLEQTVEALFDELSKRDDEFKKASEKGKLSFMKDYLASYEDENDKDIKDVKDENIEEKKEDIIDERSEINENKGIMNGSVSSKSLENVDIELNGHANVGNEKEVKITNGIDGKTDSESEEEVVEESEEEIVEESEEEVLCSSDENGE